MECSELHKNTEYTKTLNRRKGTLDKNSFVLLIQYQFLLMQFIYHSNHPRKKIRTENMRITVKLLFHQEGSYSK